ncbi:MAG TPA: protein kinase, partial [Polyangia bacterium]
MTPAASAAPDRADLLAEADHAERAGDGPGAARLLQRHLSQKPADAAARLRLGELLFALGETAAARQVLRALDEAGETGGDGGLAARGNRILALVDEREGALSSAEIRWEKILAEDIDDPEARAHLRALRPAVAHGMPDPSLATLAAPEGIRTARFRLIRELGRGSSATVYLVRDERLDLPLALKVLHPQLASAPRADARARFFAEARLAARLRHPGVVAIYEVDEATRSLAMEYLPGGTLRDLLMARGGGNTARDGGSIRRPMDPRELLATATSLLDALAYVHQAGVVHGDLKPGNVLVRSAGDVVLADFGGARLTDPTAITAGLAAGAQGTPLYLAPEQFRGAPAAPATDLFATGAILWELATGTPLRRRRDVLPETDAPVALPPAVFDDLGADGAALRALIEALLSPTPESRPPT